MDAEQKIHKVSHVTPLFIFLSFPVKLFIYPFNSERFSKKLINFFDILFDVSPLVNMKARLHVIPH